MQQQEEKKHKYQHLEDRLIDLSISTLNMLEQLPNTQIGKYLQNQVTRSATAPALIYGETFGAESRRDFIHKMKIALKELRETSIGLKLIARKPLAKSSVIAPLLKENSELIAIFVQSIKTAAKRDGVALE